MMDKEALTTVCLLVEQVLKEGDDSELARRELASRIACMHPADITGLMRDYLDGMPDVKRALQIVFGLVKEEEQQKVLCALGEDEVADEIILDTFREWKPDVVTMLFAIRNDDFATARRIYKVLPDNAFSRQISLFELEFMPASKRS